MLRIACNGRVRKEIPTHIQVNSHSDHFCLAIRLLNLFRFRLSNIALTPLCPHVCTGESIYPLRIQTICTDDQGVFCLLYEIK